MDVTNSTNCTIDNNTLSALIKNSTNKPTENGYDYFKIILLSMMALILVIGSVGNTVVCYVFGVQHKKRRSVPETLFLYLAAIDLVSSIVNPSLYIYWTVTKYARWDFGIVGCKLLVPLAPISVTLSALIILIIAVDRYFIICRQFGRNYSRNRIHCAVVASAIFSVGIYLPYIILLQVTEGSSCLVPAVGDPNYAYSTVAALMLQDVSFIVVLTFTNVKTFIRLKRQSSVKLDRSLEARRLRSHKRIARILLAMSCVFYLLVLPRDIMQLIYLLSWQTSSGLPHTDTLRRVNALLKVLQTANSCVNVFIYSKMHKKFRVHLLRLLYKITGKKHILETNVQMILRSNSELTPRSRKKMLRLSDTCETPTSSPCAIRRPIDHGRRATDGDVEGMNPLLKDRLGRIMRIRFESIEEDDFDHKINNGKT